LEKRGTIKTREGGGSSAGGNERDDRGMEKERALENNRTGGGFTSEKEIQPWTRV